MWLTSVCISRLPDSAQVTDRLTPIHYSQVRCSGEQESLLDCPLSENTAQCDHDRDAAIVCRLYERGEYPAGGIYVICSPVHI